MELKINELTADVFLELYTSVGWEPPCREQVEAALRRSTAAFTVEENGLSVAMARLIGAGVCPFTSRILRSVPPGRGKVSVLF